MEERLTNREVMGIRLAAPIPRNIVLTNGDGKRAVISFDGDAVTFGGDLPVDEAARVFFDAVGHLLKSASR